MTQIQRVGRGLAYSNISWGRNIDTHVDEIAQDYSNRQKEQFEELKRSNEEVARLGSEVQSRDSAEALDQIIASRDELAVVGKKSGTTSAAYQTKKSDILARHANINQKSAQFNDVIAEANKLRENPYIYRAEFDKKIQEELSLPLIGTSEVRGRNLNFVRESSMNPAFVNVNAYTQDAITRLSKNVKSSQMMENDDSTWIGHTEYNPNLIKMNIDGSWEPNISDELTRSIIATNPDLYKTYTKIKAPKDTKWMADHGAGEIMTEQLEVDYMKHFIQSVMSIEPSVTVSDTKNKTKDWSYYNTAGGQAAKADKESIVNLAQYIKTRNTDYLDTLFGKTDDGFSRIGWSPEGDMILYKKGKKRRDKEAIEQVFPVGVASDEDLLNHASSIFNKVGKPKIFKASKTNKNEGVKAGRDGFKMNP